MSYLVLARKWRPKQFSNVIAQQHVTQTIENAITQNRIASAYLFSGPRGVGKTTMARLLAKAVNCEQGPTITPCDECANCKEISTGRNVDVVEIDGASNRGIDEVRNVRENARFAPANGQRKVYIIDEVHMLTEQAFNALLKILEEPPAHVIFIFATTEIYKVPNTIVSRCQRFDFRRVPISEIISQLEMICENENVETDKESLYLIAKRADGSMRDSQSLLDQVISYCNKKIIKQDVADLFGLIDHELFFEVTDALANSDTKKAIVICEKIHGAGIHLGEFFDQLSEHLNVILTTRVTNAPPQLIGLESYIERYQTLAKEISEFTLLRCIQILIEAQTKLARVSNPRILLETSFLKMIHLTQLGNSTSNSGVGGVPSQKKIYEEGKSISPPKQQTLVTPQEKKLTDKDLSSDNTVPDKLDGVSVIPQFETNTTNPLISNSNNRVENERIKGGLFTSTLETQVQKVPLLRAKEANLHLAAEIQDEQAAFEEIQTKWITILDKVKDEKISLGALLEFGKPVVLKEGALQIGFGNGSGFHINSVNNQKTLIQKIIHNETGYSVRLICRKDSSNEHEVKVQSENSMNHSSVTKDGTSSSPIESANSQRLQQLFTTYPVVKQFIDAIDGELIRCHEQV